MTFSRKTSLALTLDVLSFLNKEIWAWASLQQEWWVTPPVTPRDWFRPKHRTKDAGDRLFHRISPDYSHFTFSLKKERFQQSKKKKTQGNLLSSFHSGTGYPGISEGSCKSQGLAAVTLIVLLNWASTSEDSAPLVRIGLSNQSSTRIDKATFAFIQRLEANKPKTMDFSNLPLWAWLWWAWIRSQIKIKNFPNRIEQTDLLPLV